MIKGIFSSLLFIYSLAAFGEAHVEEICKPLSRAKKWHSGDTVFYKNKVAPAFADIVEKSKPYAVKNTTFKQSLYAYGFNDDKVNEYNQTRILKDCDVSNLSSNTCHHFQAYCLNSITTKTLNHSFDSFNKCAIHRYSWCGKSFETPEGILGNLRELEEASNEILKTQEKISKDPHMNNYFGDINRSFEELKRKLAEAKQNAKNSASDLEKEIEEKYARLRKEDARFNSCCKILDQCDDYLKKEDYEDKYSILNQTVFCDFSNSYTDNELKPLVNLLAGLNKQNEKENLKILALNSLDNSIKQTVTEYASTYKALYGSKPTQSKMCTDLPKFCQNEKAKSYLTNLDLSKVEKLNTSKEIKTYNEQAKKMNRLCQQAKGNTVSKELEAQINNQLYEVMYTTRIGQLMGVQNFREKIPPFDQESCFNDGVGFKKISEDATGNSLVNEAIKSMMQLLKDKSSKLSDQQDQVTYAGNFTDASDEDYYKILKDIVRNDPYMIKESIRNSGSPEQALWICKATHDIYQTESYEQIGTWIGTGLAIAGSLIATVFTFGAATPLLIGSIALATSVGVYNLNNAITARHNAEQSIAIKSGELVLASMNLTNLDSSVKAAYFEIGMSLLPGAMKGLQIAGKAVGPALKSSQLLSSLPVGSKLTGPAKALMDAINKGQKVTTEMIQKALASRLPNASPDKLKMFASFLQGTSADMSLEMIVFVSSYPDPPGPFSETGMQSLALALGTSAGFNSLGLAGQQWVLKRKANQTQTLIANQNNAQLNLHSNIERMPTYTTKETTHVYRDASKPNQKDVLAKFESQVEMNDRVIELMESAHTSPDGFAKNRQIKLLIDEISTQPGMTQAKAKDLVLGTPDELGIRKGGLASEDTMILGDGFQPVKISNLSDIDCENIDCSSLVSYLVHTHPDLKINRLNPLQDFKAKLRTQMQNANMSLHNNKHLKADINTEVDFKRMPNDLKKEGQYFNFMKEKIKNGSQLEKELLRNDNIGFYEFNKKGVMYKYVSFEDFKKHYPEIAKDYKGFGWGEDCKGLANFIRIELTNSSTPEIHSHPRCMP